MEALNMKNPDSPLDRDPRDEKLPAGEIVFDSPTLKKADNFWFYNKWKIIIGGFLLVLGVCIWQSCSKDGYDTMLMYAGPYQGFTDSKIYNGTRDALNVAVPEDYDGDGERNCEIAALVIFSDEQIKQMRDDAATASKSIVVNTELNNQELQKFDQLIMAGEYSVCLLDPSLYERVRSAGGFRKLADVLGSVPECANDEYSIRFADTAFAQYYDVFDDLPPDTLLCLRTKSTYLSAGSGGRYEVSERFFKNIVEFIP